MLNLLRAGAATTVAAAAITASLVLAPAASAATHPVTKSEKVISVSVKVGDHKDRLVYTALDKHGVKNNLDPSNKTYFATNYQLKLTHGKKTLFTKKVPTWVAVDGTLDVAVHGKYKSDAALVAELKQEAKLSNATAHKQAATLYGKIIFEFTSELGLGFIQLAAKNAENNTWPETLPLTNTAAGTTYVITGTPSDYTVAFTSTKHNATLTYTSKTDSTVRTNWVELKGVK